MKYRKKGFDYSLLNERVINIPEEDVDFDWKEKGVYDKLVVEIGCGNGHFLTEKALEEPSTLFIGIDLKDYRIIKSRMKEIKNQLTNMRWVVGEAGRALEKLFKDNSINTIYMTFPDPWPKKRHHKNRLFQNPFIQLLKQKLTDDGQFVFISDHEEYYLWCVALIENDENFQLNTGSYDEALTNSAFAEIWKRENRDFFSFTLKKQA